MNLDNLQGDELFAYLRNNKKELIQSTRDSVKLSDAIKCTVKVYPTNKEITTLAEDGTEDSSEPLPEGQLKVTIVGNAAWIFGSHSEVLTDKAYTESITLRGNSIPHIADHEHVSTAHVGDTQRVYTKKMDLRSLGMDAEGKTTALLFDSIVRKDYNEKVYKFYKNGKINQHSIGLNADSIKLAINSEHEGDVEEKKVWDANFPNILNKEEVAKRGYFFLIDKADIKEVSTVLFGSNPLTPTLSNTSDKIILSLGNKEETVITQPIGNTMTPLEEAQGKIISLTEELAAAKAALPLAEASAKLKEKTRTLGILKAQTTFGSEEALTKAALEFIEKDYDLTASTSMLESLKTHIQTTSHVDTTEATLKSTQLKPNPSGEVSFEDSLLAGLKSLGEQPQLFKGVR